MNTQFNYLKAWLQSFTKTERGASLVEYALLVALIAVACIAAVVTLGGTVRGQFNAVDQGLRTTTTQAP